MPPATASASGQSWFLPVEEVRQEQVWHLAADLDGAIFRPDPGGEVRSWYRGNIVYGVGLESWYRSDLVRDHTEKREREDRV